MIITTPYDTFSIARLINQSMPIKEFMTREHLVTFDIDDYVDDVKETMSKIRHRDFPILDENGNYLGMVSRRNLMSMQKNRSFWWIIMRSRRQLIISMKRRF